MLLQYQLSLLVLAAVDMLNLLAVIFLMMAAAAEP
jgi:hypothetical protein